MLNKATAISLEMMSETKFYSDYSRWIDSAARFETWSESVKRVMDMHRDRYASAMSPRLLNLIGLAESAYSQKWFLGAQRALQFGGEQVLKHQVRLYNCFGRETRFVTSAGMKSFYDFNDGDTTLVMTHTGSWKPAVVRNYGKQFLNTVVFKKNTTQKTVRVTGNHRWLLNDGSVTTNLKVGDRILKEPKVFEKFSWENASIEEKLYWAYGFVYGDGTLSNGYSLVRLCGHKRQYEDRFTSLGFGSSSSLSLMGDIIVYTGTYQKTLPDADVTHPSLMRAFVAGYLDADGDRNNNESGKKFTGIQTSNIESMEFIENKFPIAGVHVVGAQNITNRETNFGLHSNSMRYTTCDSSGSKYNAGWKVDNIFTNTHMEDVWCLEVEDDQSFILESGLVTGNCAFSYCDRTRFFQEAMYVLLCGCGVGFSVQKHHVDKLPKIKSVSRENRVIFTVPDSIEGWSDAFGVLISSYFVGGGEFPEYEGKHVVFDYDDIRPKGALISGGFKAPGPEPLRKSLELCRDLLEKQFSTQNVEEGGLVKLRPIVAYDFVMHMGDAVLSGGVRRSATICIFSKDDEEMLNAKTSPNWFDEEPQRKRSNNSALLLRDELDRHEFADIMKKTKMFGEPGFIFASDTEHGFNPCVEIGLRAYDENGESGWQFCNL